MKTTARLAAGLLLLPFAAAAALAFACPEELTDDLPNKYLYRCPAVYKPLCASVCGPRYDASEVREVRQLRPGEKAVICVDSSIAAMKKGISYAEDRENHGCFGGAKKSAWCVDSGRSVGGRRLGAYFQCAARLAPDYEQNKGWDEAPHTVRLLNTPEPPLVPPAAHGTESTGPEPAPAPRRYGRPQAAPRPAEPAGRPYGLPPAYPGQPPGSAAAPPSSENIEDFGPNRFVKMLNEPKMKEALEKKGQLQEAVRRYAAAHGGVFPATLNELVPEYIKEIPSLDLPGYRKTWGHQVTRSVQGGAVLLRDTGMWLYIYEPGYKRHGAVSFDSAKKYRGKPLSDY